MIGFWRGSKVRGWELARVDSVGDQGETAGVTGGWPGSSRRLSTPKGATGVAELMFRGGAVEDNVAKVGRVSYGRGSTPGRRLRGVQERTPQFIVRCEQGDT